MDLFGRYIRLTFNGKDKFRTRFGTFCTVLMAIIFMFYSLFVVVRLSDPKNAVPVVSKISRSSFYELNEGTESIVEPNGEKGSLGAYTDPVRP